MRILKGIGSGEGVDERRTQRSFVQECEVVFAALALFPWR